MSSVLLAVADALAADLTAHSFSLPFTAARTYADAEYQLDAADGMVPGTQAIRAGGSRRGAVRRRRDVARERDEPEQEQRGRESLQRPHVRRR